MKDDSVVEIVDECGGANILLRFFTAFLHDGGHQVVFEEIGANMSPEAGTQPRIPSRDSHLAATTGRASLCRVQAQLLIFCYNS
jgi:hypothetical protein